MEVRYKEIMDWILTGRIVRATQYISPTYIVRATRKLYGKRIIKNDRSINILLTLGKPNYLERKFIKLCQKADIVFPLKRIQLKDYMPKKNKLKRK